MPKKTARKIPRVTFIGGSVGPDGLIGPILKGEMKVRLGPGWTRFNSGQKRRKAG
ncbi:MAG: hypothetical protein IT462_07680 [Planctomycetes bacterium]|nr:hypothetical protein [Planctomycetota bacterium]